MVGALGYFVKAWALLSAWYGEQEESRKAKRTNLMASQAQFRGWFCRDYVMRELEQR
jgi:hypothetical protein